MVDLTPEQKKHLNLALCRISELEKESRRLSLYLIFSFLLSPFRFVFRVAFYALVILFDYRFILFALLLLVAPFLFPSYYTASSFVIIFVSFIFGYLVGR